VALFEDTKPRALDSGKRQRKSKPNHRFCVHPVDKQDTMAGMASDPKRELLRHTVATLAYRGGKAVRGAAPEFAGYHAAETTRTPGQILAHIGDLLDWSLSVAKGKEAWHNSAPLAWDREVQRFFAALERLDAYLASDAPLAESAEKLFQAPIADALTHVGQIAMLRRMAGCATRGENYHAAEIAVGRVGPEQIPPRREFD
jgi:hypothetical protein